MSSKEFIIKLGKEINRLKTKYDIEASPDYENNLTKLKNALKGIKKVDLYNYMLSEEFKDEDIGFIQFVNHFREGIDDIPNKINNSKEIIGAFKENLKNSTFDDAKMLEVISQHKNFDPTNIINIYKLTFKELEEQLLILNESDSFRTPNKFENSKTLMETVVNNFTLLFSFRSRVNKYGELFQEKCDSAIVENRGEYVKVKTKEEYLKLLKISRNKVNTNIENFDDFFKKNSTYFGDFFKKNDFISEKVIKSYFKKMFVYLLKLEYNGRLFIYSSDFLIDRKDVEEQLTYYKNMRRDTENKKKFYEKTIKLYKCYTSFNEDDIFVWYEVYKNYEKIKYKKIEKNILNDLNDLFNELWIWNFYRYVCLNIYVNYFKFDNYDELMDFFKHIKYYEQFQKELKVVGIKEERVKPFINELQNRLRSFYIGFLELHSKKWGDDKEEKKNEEIIPYKNNNFSFKTHFKFKGKNIDYNHDYNADYDKNREEGIIKYKIRKYENDFKKDDNFIIALEHEHNSKQIPYFLINYAISDKETKSNSIIFDLENYYFLYKLISLFNQDDVMASVEGMNYANKNKTLLAYDPDYNPYVLNLYTKKNGKEEAIFYLQPMDGLVQAVFPEKGQDFEISYITGDVINEALVIAQKILFQIKEEEEKNLSKVKKKKIIKN